MQPSVLVSIMINNFNYGQYLGAAIESALNQTYPDVEVVVVDDGSTDRSREVIESFGGRIVAVLKSNQGQASAFNWGFKHCRGELVFLLDSDDLFLPEKVARIAKIFGEKPEIGWCWDVERKFKGTPDDRLPFSHTEPTGTWDCRQQMEHGSPPLMQTACSGLAFRRQLLGEILPLPEVTRGSADGFIKLAALALAPGWIEAEEVTLQRIHESNMYTNQPKKRRHLAGVAGLLIGIYFDQKFPRFKRLAFHMATRGIGRCWATGGVDRECQPMLRQFLRRQTRMARASLWARSLYWAARSLARV